MAGDAKTILIVDDEPDIMEAVQLALTLEGYAVKGATDRETALGIIDTEAPGLILLDYRMPGVTTLDFVTQVRDRHPDSTLVLMTAIKDASEQARELGLSHWLSKPFELNDLLNLVRQYAA